MTNSDVQVTSFPHNMRKGTLSCRNVCFAVNLFLSTFVVFSLTGVGFVLLMSDLANLSLAWNLLILLIFRNQMLLLFYYRYRHGGDICRLVILVSPRRHEPVKVDIVIYNKKFIKYLFE